MGKTTGLFTGVVRGKTGNVVGFRLTNSNSKEKQGWREYVAKISNPRSYAQAKQRAKVIPASIFYRAFSNVLNHAFLPSGNADRNRKRFMSYAMRLDEISDVQKGWNRIPFIDYRISEGNLGLDSMVVGTYNASGVLGVAFKGIAVGSATPSSVASYTIGQFSQLLLQQNPQLKEGMELTFISVVENSDTMDRFAAVVSFVLDSSNSLRMYSDLNTGLVKIKPASTLGLTVENNTKDGVEYRVLSAGCIISARSGKSWTYTNSNMCMSTHAVDGYDWDPEDTIASYMTAATTSESDKLLQQADNAQQAGITQESMSTAAVTASGVTLNSQTVATVVLSNGARKVVVNAAGVPFQGTAVSGSYYLLGDSESNEVELADTSLAGQPTILASDVTLGYEFVNDTERP